MQCPLAYSLISHMFQVVSHIENKVHKPSSNPWCKRHSVSESYFFLIYFFYCSSLKISCYMLQDHATVIYLHNRYYLLLLLREKYRNRACTSEIPTGSRVKSVKNVPNCTLYQEQHVKYTEDNNYEHKWCFFKNNLHLSHFNISSLHCFYLSELKY